MKSDVAKPSEQIYGADMSLHALTKAGTRAELSVGLTPIAEALRARSLAVALRTAEAPLPAERSP